MFRYAINLKLFAPDNIKDIYELTSDDYKLIYQRDFINMGADSSLIGATILYLMDTYKISFMSIIEATKKDLSYCTLYEAIDNYKLLLATKREKELIFKKRFLLKAVARRKAEYDNTLHKLNAIKQPNILPKKARVKAIELLAQYNLLDDDFI